MAIFLTFVVKAIIRSADLNFFELSFTFERLRVAFLQRLTLLVRMSISWWYSVSQHVLITMIFDSHYMDWFGFRVNFIIKCGLNHLQLSHSHVGLQKLQKLHDKAYFTSNWIACWKQEWLSLSVKKYHPTRPESLV